jgi:hypothetical protein
LISPDLGAEQMDNKGVLIGSIIFVFGSFILMIGMMLWESNTAY